MDLHSLTRTVMAKETAPQNAPLSHFFVTVTGQIESGDFAEGDDLYCRYAFTFGPDWTVVTGIDNGLSQISRKSTADAQEVVWNFPIEATFKSTNAYGWPRIAVSVYGVDMLGRDVLQGYGGVLVPPIAGYHEVDVAMYAPLASSPFVQFTSWLTGNAPEFFDSNFVTQSDNRAVTRVRTTGQVKVKLNVITRGMKAFGYSASEESAAQPSTQPQPQPHPPSYSSAPSRDETLSATLRAARRQNSLTGATSPSSFDNA